MQSNIRVVATLAVIATAVLPASALSDESISFHRITSDISGTMQTIQYEGEETNTHTVTDIQLDLHKWDGDISGAVSAANDPERHPFYWNFAAQLFVVANGTLNRDGYGMCSAWKEDTSVCTIECDGGHFLLKRNLTKDQAEITLILRPVPELIEGDESSSIRIGDCGDGSEILLGTVENKPVEVAFSGWINR